MKHVSNREFMTAELYLQKFVTGRYSDIWNSPSTLEVDNSIINFCFQSLFANKNNVVANAQMLLVFRFIEQEIINTREANRNGIDSIYDEENITLYNLTESWLPCASSFAFWGYDCYFGSYLTPYNTYGSMQDSMIRLYEINAKIVWMQGAYNLRHQTGFDDVKTYLWSKLMWNRYADVNALIQNFFDNVYQEASQDMYNAFLQMRIGMELQKSKDLGKGIWMQPATSTEWWGQRMMEQMLDTFELAKTKIESYKISDPKRYQAMLDNIVKESIFPRYLLIEAYSSTYSSTQLVEMKTSFRADVERLDINQLSEGVSMTDYLNANGY